MRADRIVEGEGTCSHVTHRNGRDGFLRWR
jgi:hypothetical protein